MRLIAVGGGYHVGVTPGSDWIAIPSAPTGDVRFHLLGRPVGRYGPGARRLGGTAVDEHGVHERHRPTYLQLLARFRATDSVILGVGGGLWGYGERFDGGSSYGWHPHLLAVEALHARRTRPAAQATALEVLTVAAALGAAVHGFDLVGAVAASAAILAGRAAGVARLAAPCVRASRAGPAAETHARGESDAASTEAMG